MTTSTDGPRLAMWSGPRNISTALMRAWENRPDCDVVDEPLYAYYLHSTGIDHPGREEVLASQRTDLAEIVDALVAPVPPDRIAYQKHMAHHLLDDTDRSWIPRLTNVLLIRNPREVVASYIRTRSTVRPEDIGIPQQVALLDLLGTGTPVIDASDFLRDPEGYLRWLCEWIGVEFMSTMLHWPPGPRESDGVWAPYWYGAVRRSTGFEPWRRRDVELEGSAAEVAAACSEGYEHLHGRRVRI
jgi:Sulfotransferase domain